MKLKILVIDDEEAIRDIIRHGFEAGYEVHAAGDGRTGIEQYKKYDPDLIFLDMNLPDMTGLEIFSVLKARGCRAVVIMLTGNEDLALAQRALDKGISQYVTKPFDLEYLRGAVQDALSKRPGGGGRPWRIQP
ncbi:MAG TPA: hypothetical protein DCM05_12860 [Elusimicrobia bacterium]|nr:hypothetical protein [Elusimicrobiota bacterium]